MPTIFCHENGSAVARSVECETILPAAPIIRDVPGRTISDRLRYQRGPLSSRIDPGPVTDGILPLASYPEAVVS